MKKLDTSRLDELRRRCAPFELKKRPEGTLFIHLARSIASQQLSLKAAATIYSRFAALCPEGVPTPETVLALPITKLRTAGLSQAKALALQDLSHKALAGVVPTDAQARRLSDDELVERLTAVRGVGRWTVEMVLMFRYRRPDVWPVDDLGVQKGFRLMFPSLKFKDRKDLTRLGVRWAGQRSEIAWYAWRALEEEQLQSWTGVPLQHAGLKLMLWLRGGVPARVDFTRHDAPPVARWPGKVTVSKHRQAHWQRQLVEVLKKGPSGQDWHWEGTPFQQAVWREILRIPFGETRTYLEVATAVGNPKGVRAVAPACGANRLPLLIPCHRVVATGGLGGFGGGADKKKRLLAAEGVHFL